MSDPDIDRAYNVRNTVSVEQFDSIMAEYRSRSDGAIAGLDGFRDIEYDPRADSDWTCGA